MNLINLLLEMDKMYKQSSNMFDTMSVVVPIIMGVVSVATIVLIIVIAIKASKRVKKIVNSENEEGGLLSNIRETIEDASNPHIICEYCGSSNKKEDSTCKNCGANLNRNNKKKK